MLNYRIVSFHHVVKKVIKLIRNHHGDHNEKMFQNSGSKILNALFGKYLLYTNTVSGGVLMGLGDLIEQEIEIKFGDSKERFNWRRTCTMTIVGLSMGPLHHYFYLYLDKFIPKRNLTSIGKKIVIDQFLMSPICVFWFLFFNGILIGQTVKETLKEIHMKYLDVYAADALLWPMAMFINFKYIPMKYQVSYVNFLTLLFDTILSYIKYKEDKGIVLDILRKIFKPPKDT